MMEWSRESCLQLLDVYEKHPVLWNPKHGLYYNKVKKHDAWAIIDETIGCHAGEAKKKMESMLASFRREKAKGKKSVGTGKGRHEIYISKWFAFPRMAFLLDRDEPRATIDSIEVEAPADEYESVEEPVLDHEEEGREDAADTQTFPNNEIDPKLPQTPVAKQSNLEQKCKRRKLSESADDLKVKEALDILKSASSSNSLNADECGVYGQHVAHKLRSYSKKTRVIVQHHINTLLFRADMGEYNSIDSRPSSASNSGSSIYSVQPNQSSTFSAWNTLQLAQTVTDLTASTPSPQAQNEPQQSMNSTTVSESQVDSVQIYYNL